MKDQLLKNYCTSRKKIDELATKLNLSKVGSRENVFDRIKGQSYSTIKKAIFN